MKRFYQVKSNIIFGYLFTTGVKSLKHIIYLIKLQNKIMFQKLELVCQYFSDPDLKSDEEWENKFKKEDCYDPSAKYILDKDWINNIVFISKIV